MNDIIKTLIRNVLLLIILASVGGFLYLFEAQDTVIMVGVLGTLVLVKADDYRLRRIRRLATA